MDKIEKAVIDLGGVWGGYDPKHEMYLLIDKKTGKVKYVFWFPNPIIHNDWVVEYICSESEFMETRKRLENKPSWRDAPEWATNLAQDADGGWHWYPQEPNPSGVMRGGQWTHDCRNAGMITASHAGYGSCFDDWRKTLESRPQLDNKQGESVEWEPGADLPPVGQIVEFRHGDGEWFGPGRVFHITKQRVCFIEYEDGGFDRSSEPVRFRPAQSHRDKCIEAAAKHLNSKGWISRENELMSLYEAGFLQIPNDEEEKQS